MLTAEGIHATQTACKWPGGHEKTKKTTKKMTKKKINKKRNSTGNQTRVHMRLTDITGWTNICRSLRHSSTHSRATIAI